MKKIIWGNSIVKNEDRYLWFAVKSIINYLDKLIIFDTGSIDKTVEIIKDLQNEYPDKIIFEQKNQVDPEGLTSLRQEMLKKTQSDWLILLDGDEVWWENSIKGVTKKITDSGNEIYALVNPVINLIGDIYHYQEEKAGEYEILGKKGHFNIRAINRNIPGLHLKNEYPLEGFYNNEEKLIQSVEDKLEFIELPILHFSHLQRSSLNDKNTLHRNKLKIEIGEKFAANFQYPEALYLPRPKNVKNPFKKMSFGYKIKASIATPLKKIKRYLKNEIKS